MITFTCRADPGLLPEFFSLDDPRPARDQLHEAYAHGGGVRPFDGFTVLGSRDDPESLRLSYPGDPELPALAYAHLRNELIVMFTYSWVAIFPLSGAPIITRCD